MYDLQTRNMIIMTKIWESLNQENCRTAALLKQGSWLFRFFWKKWTLMSTDKFYTIHSWQKPVDFQKMHFSTPLWGNYTHCLRWFLLQIKSEKWISKCLINHFSHSDKDIQLINFMRGHLCDLWNGNYMTNNWLALNSNLWKNQTLFKRCLA